MYVNKGGDKVSKANIRFIEPLDKAPEIEVPRTETVAELIVNEYIESGLAHVSVSMSKVGKAYKNAKSLARVLGKFIKKAKLEDVSAIAQENKVYITKAEPIKEQESKE
jgi:hypothetical protein